MAAQQKLAAAFVEQHQGKLLYREIFSDHFFDDLERALHIHLLAQGGENFETAIIFEKQIVGVVVPLRHFVRERQLGLYAPAP
jgi:hypothetical protein